MSLDLGVQMLEKKKWTSQLSVNLPECKPWERTLQTVQERIISDQTRHSSHSQLLKANNQRMHDLMALHASGYARAVLGEGATTLQQSLGCQDAV